MSPPSPLSVLPCIVRVHRHRAVYDSAVNVTYVRDVCHRHVRICHTNVTTRSCKGDGTALRLTTEHGLVTLLLIDQYKRTSPVQF